MTAQCRRAARPAAILGLALGVWWGAPSDWTAAAQSSPQKWTATSKTDDNVPPAPRKGGQGIVVVVNDEAITAYEIEQRAGLLALNANLNEQAKEHFDRLVKSQSTQEQLRALEKEVIQSNPGKTQQELIAIFQDRQKEIGMSLRKQALDGARASILPKLRKEAREELINDRLKLQSAKKHGIEISDADVKALLKDLAERNKMTYDQFGQHLKGMGIEITAMGERFRAQKAWRDLVTRRYSVQVSVTQRDIDRVLSTAALEAGTDSVELQVHKLSLTLAGKVDQPSLTKRYAEAESLRRRFAGCRKMAELAKNAPDTQFHDMKYLKPSSIAEPMRSLLLSAKDDDVLPPVTTSAGSEIYAVCGRRPVTGNEQQRQKALAELQGKELDVLARQHLRNLRQEANIEYK